MKPNLLMRDVVRELRHHLPELPGQNRTGLISLRNMPQMTRAFFPGGNGLYDGDDSTHRTPAKTLILGSNFGCIGKFIDENGILKEHDERENSTWKPLLRAIRDSGMDPRECFFTNAWPYLHPGNNNVTRNLIPKWLRDDQLMDGCRRFFLLTLQQMQPNLVIALGLGAAPFLGALFPELDHWRGGKIRHLNLLPMKEVRVADRKIIFVAVTHPCINNSRWRSPPYQNRDGEARLIAEALSAAEQL